jgi:hypothetical protein
MNRLLFGALALASITSVAGAQAIAARRLEPNLEDNIATPLRYRPDGADFVIENGMEFFNRPLYGGHTAFRVDTGDKPEFVLYGLPGRGGNLRLGIRNAGAAKWLSAVQSVTARYRPGGMIYDIRDPLLGQGTLHIEAYALAATEGLIVRVEGRGTPAGVEWLWAYGGANGQRGARDGDIGTERVPISEYFQLSPDFCHTNVYEPAAGAFTMRFPISNNPVAIFGRTPGDAKPEIADARQWGNPAQLFASVNATPAAAPVIVGHVPLVAEARYLSLQRLGNAAAPGDLQVVTGNAPATVPATTLLPAFKYDDLPKVFADAETHFKALRERVAIETPDPFINAAAGALNVAADAVWDDAQKAIMHGAVAWRQKLLGWRGQYALDALGWHDRAADNFATWAPRQNTRPIPEQLPGPDEASNLARSENALHSNGDMSNSHYDMNLVHIDAAFRHILWTGDLEFAKREWPIIERHLAWEQRMFRRPYGPEKLPLYEAYAAIWASDDLQYNGGGAAHASAYNYYHNMMAARVAKVIGKDPAPYEKEAALIAQAMRKHLWLPEKGWMAEYRDYLGLQAAHDSAALWTVYHTMDSELLTPTEAWQMSRYLDTALPRIPVRGAGVPADEPYALLPTSTWMPYLWSINNVCMNENNATSLAYFQAGRADEGTRLLKSGILASMYMGIAPGNVGTMTYLDVYRRESQRDFGDGSGTLSRTMVEGLFGIRPDALARELRITPGFPRKWEHASIRHPDMGYSFKRAGQTDTYVIDSKFASPMALRLEVPALAENASVTVNGQPAKWAQPEDAVGMPRIIVTAPASAKWEVAITRSGAAIAAGPLPIRAIEGAPVDFKLDPRLKLSLPAGAHITDPQHVLTAAAPTNEWTNFKVRASALPGKHTVFVGVAQGAMQWRQPVEIDIAPPAAAPRAGYDWAAADPGAKYESVDLTKQFNDRVSQIFRHEYRSPRSSFVSLAIPKQGLGAWAGEVNQTATIDDAGLRAAAGRNSGKLLMPNGVPFATPSAAAENNILFTSQFDNFPKEAKIPLTGKAKRVLLLMAGSTNHMQSRFDNGEVIATYTDGETSRLALENPTTWWPIEQDYFVDDYQFRRPGPLPPRINLRTGEVRLLDPATFKGRGGRIDGGAATALELPLIPQKELQSLTVRTLANEVVIGLMAATLER